MYHFCFKEKKYFKINLFKINLLMEAQTLQEYPLNSLNIHLPISKSLFPPAECDLSGPGHYSLLLCGSAPYIINAGEH